MKNTIRILSALALSLSLFAVSANAADNPMNELNFGLGATSLLGNGAGNNAVLTFGSGVDTSFGVNVGYSRTLMDCLQGTFEGDFFTQSGTTAMFLRAGPTFNLAIDNTGIRNAVYLAGLGGISLLHAGSITQTNFAYKVELGKRFEIFQGLAWKPAFNMTGFTATGQNPLFSFVPAQFAAMF